MYTPLHVINVKDTEGLLDLIALGNIIEFAAALDHRTYENVVVHKEEREEQEVAMTDYRRFIRWFSKAFGTLISGTWVNPSYLFKLRLICFGASVGEYFTREHPVVQKHDGIPGITPSAVKKMIRRHIQNCWADILAGFDLVSSDPSPFLYHIGPPIEIIEKTPLRLAEANLTHRTEYIDYAPEPIYILKTGAPPVSLPVVNQAAKRDRIPTSPASPSNLKAIKRRK
jgi:hypothetical protein